MDASRSPLGESCRVSCISMELGMFLLVCGYQWVNDRKLVEDYEVPMYSRMHLYPGTNYLDLWIGGVMGLYTVFL